MLLLIGGLGTEGFNAASSVCVCVLFRDQIHLYVCKFNFGRLAFENILIIRIRLAMKCIVRIKRL